MEAVQKTPAGRRCMRILMRLGIFAALVAALKVNAILEGSRLVTFLIIATAFILAYHFTSNRWLRVVMFILGIPVFLVLVNVLILTDSYVSASAPSPDGRIVAEVYEVRTMPDYNFLVCLKTKGGWWGSRSKCVFRSPDEGPPDTQRLLWSKDGRYLLLLMTRKGFTLAQEEARLASGEYLYLLVDTEKDVVYANAREVCEPRPFSVNDLSSIDFGESFTPRLQPESTRRGQLSSAYVERFGQVMGSSLLLTNNERRNRAEQGSESNFLFPQTIRRSAAHTTHVFAITKI